MADAGGASASAKVAPDRDRGFQLPVHSLSGVRQTVAQIAFMVAAGYALCAAPAQAATFVLDASAPTTVTFSNTGVTQTQYNVFTSVVGPSSTHTDTKSVTNQYNFDWYAPNPVSVTTRRIYFERDGVTLGALQYFAQTYGGSGPAGTPWITSFVAFYTDQQDSTGLPPANIPQISYVTLTGNSYQLPEFGAAQGLTGTIMFGGAGPGSGTGGGDPIISAPVPEPATWAMMITGLGMAGAALRSRRRRQPSATILT